MQNSLNNNSAKTLVPVITGLENLCGDYPQSSIYREKLKQKRLGLLANPASVDSLFRHASILINSIYPNQLKALFSPQHGFYAEKQDNMIESDHLIDPILNIPIFSLYSKTRIPTKEMFDLIDTLIVDIQDVGTRVYTFIYTISYCLEIAAKYGKEVVILDRPNPIGGLAIEGNLLKKDCSSFVGRFEIPMRHAMTVGEISKCFNAEFIDYRKSIGSKNGGCDLTVIPMIGWKRSMFFQDTNLPWIAPSPNLPTPYSALVYPGQVIWEGTNISEGRGTTKPFEIFGSPFIDPQKILSGLVSKNSADQLVSKNSITRDLDVVEINGAVLRPIAFEPASGKWQGRVCYGFQIHIIDSTRFKPYKTSLLLLQQIIKHHFDQFKWKEPPYEYEYVKPPIDLIVGDKKIREAVENFEDIDTIEESWQNELDEFSKMSRKFYLYE